MSRLTTHTHTHTHTHSHTHTHTHTHARARARTRWMGWRGERGDVQHTHTHARARTRWMGWREERGDVQHTHTHTHTHTRWMGWRGERGDVQLPHAAWRARECRLLETVDVLSLAVDHAQRIRRLLEGLVDDTVDRTKTLEAGRPDTMPAQQQLPQEELLLRAGVHPPKPPDRRTPRPLTWLPHALRAIPCEVPAARGT
eukprot:SAG11_NODE_324_length_10739_cov_86.975752_8_plen_199_part_00